MTSDYQSKKAFYDRMITIYGRKPVLEALNDPEVPIYKLHLADSNKSAGIINDMLRLAQKRAIEVVYHSKQELSRISRNSKQDQGVAADIKSELYDNYQVLLGHKHHQLELIALDGITNPQNLGMIIRSVCAAGIDGILLPEKGCSEINPLVIKASVGTLFKTRIYRCKDLANALLDLQKDGWETCVMSSHAQQDIASYQATSSTIYIMGNETEGVSKPIMQHADKQLMIPMSNGVESLNVAVTASLIAFRKHFQRDK